MTSDISSHSTLLIGRLHALLGALRDGPLARPDLFTQVGHVYPPALSSQRVMVDRDVKWLRELGIVIEISRTRPPIYTLHGGTPNYTHEHLRTLALVRDSFGPRHPQAEQIRNLLDILTKGLDTEQQAAFASRQVTSVPLQPVIDYTPHAPTIMRLEQAISGHEIINFNYKNSRGDNKKHQVEPYEIEYYERHFYLVAYSQPTHQTLDYRIDRVSAIQLIQTLPPHLSRTHERSSITFRYRLAAALAQGEISQRFENQRVVKCLPNGDKVIEAEGRSDFFIIQMLLRYRSNAELLEPPWLREKMAQEVRRLGEVYGVSGES